MVNPDFTFYKGCGSFQPGLAGRRGLYHHQCLCDAGICISGSGYFSKKPDRSKETSFHTFMWPYLLGIPFFYFVRQYFFGNAILHWDLPPFALWYLWALFFYRYFTKEWMKIPYILELSIVVYLLAGQVPFFSDRFGLGRMVSYFPFFVMAFYCTSDQIKKLQCLKKWQCWALGTVLLGISCLLAFCVPQLPVGFYLLKNPACELGITWYWDIIGRALILFLAWGWIIFMLNILPNKKNYLAYVGMNTMPIYIFHLIVRYAIKFNGIGLGIVPVNNWVVYYGMILDWHRFAQSCFRRSPSSRSMISSSKAPGRSSAGCSRAVSICWV